MRNVIKYILVVVFVLGGLFSIHINVVGPACTLAAQGKHWLDFTGAVYEGVKGACKLEKAAAKTAEKVFKKAQELAIKVAIKVKEDALKLAEGGATVVVDRVYTDTEKLLRVVGKGEEADKIAKMRKKVIEKIGKDFTVAGKFKMSPKIKDIEKYIREGGEAVAKAPALIKDLYDGLEKSKLKIEAGLNKVQIQIHSLPDMRKTIQDNKLITSNIKKPALEAIDSLSLALSKLSSVLRGFYEASTKLLDDREPFIKFINKRVELVRKAREEKGSGGETLEQLLLIIAKGLDKEGF